MKELLTAIASGLVENPEAVNVTVDEANDDLRAQRLTAPQVRRMLVTMG